MPISCATHSHFLWSAVLDVDDNLLEVSWTFSGTNKEIIGRTSCQISKLAVPFDGLKGTRMMTCLACINFGQLERQHDRYEHPRVE